MKLNIFRSKIDICVKLWLLSQSANTNPNPKISSTRILLAKWRWLPGYPTKAKHFREFHVNLLGQGQNNWGYWQEQWKIATVIVAALCTFDDPGWKQAQHCQFAACLLARSNHTLDGRCTAVHLLVATKDLYSSWFFSPKSWSWFLHPHPRNLDENLVPNVSFFRINSMISRLRDQYFLLWWVASKASWDNQLQQVALAARIIGTLQCVLRQRQGVNQRPDYTEILTRFFIRILTEILVRYLRER